MNTDKIENIDEVKAYKCSLCFTLYESYVEACECCASHVKIASAKALYRSKEVYPNSIEVYFDDGACKKYVCLPLGV